MTARIGLFLCLNLILLGMLGGPIFGADKADGRALPALDPALKQGAVYEKARLALLKNGWKPVIATDRNIYGEMTSRVGVPGILYEAGFKEVYFCGATGYCLFNFVKNGKCLRISTLGDYVKGKFPRIHSWWEECYKPE